MQSAFSARTWINALAILLGLLPVSCAFRHAREAGLEELTSLQTESIWVDTISQDDRAEKAFVVRSGMSELTNESLRFLEIRRYVENALVEIGYGSANRIEGADFVVFVSFGISDVRREETVLTQGSTLNGGSELEITKRDDRYDGSVGPSWTSSHSKSKTFTKNFLTRKLTLRAVPAHAKNKLKQTTEFWETTIVSEGEGDDWRTLIPKMLAGASDWIGKDTAGRKQVYFDSLSEIYSRQVSSIVGNNGTSLRSTQDGFTEARASHSSLQGCCSHHGGPKWKEKSARILYCLNSMIACQDNTSSPSCVCPRE